MRTWSLVSCHRLSGRFSDWLVELMQETCPNILLYVPPNLWKKCKTLRLITVEGFADRSYSWQTMEDRNQMP
jgi:hypothetical protein